MLFIVLLSVFVMTATAQTNTTLVIGNVLDTTGLPLPGAQIKFETSSCVRLSVIGGSDGGFSLSLPSRGRYAVRVNASGFAVLTRTIDLNTFTGRIVLRLASVASVSAELIVRPTWETSNLFAATLHDNHL